MKNTNHKERRTGYMFLLIFGFLSAGIVTGGYFAYRNYEKNYRSEVERRLSAIADLKVSQLVQWRKERLGDANVFYKNNVFSDLVKRYFKNKSDADAKKRINAWMGQIAASYTYDRICLHDIAGTERISFPESKIHAPLLFSKRSAEVLKSGKVEFQDFYRDENDKKVYLTIFVPLLDEFDSGKKLGILALRIDPAQYLYPMTEKWPTPSRTSETLIIRRDGNDALFLNNIRFQKDAALDLRIPLERKDVLAVKSILGKEGIVEGIDYRGEQVIGYVRTIPDSPWYLVARMDMEEVYAPLKERLWLMIILVGALFIGAGASVGLVWRLQRGRFYREQFKSAEALRNSETRYRRLFEAARDGILILDAETGMIVDANPFLIEMLGYTHEQFLGKKLWEVGFLKDTVSNEENFLELQQKEYIRYEDMPLETNDGRTFHVEFVSNVYLVDHHKVIQCNIRDITERKRAEEALRKSEEKYRSIFENVQDVYYETSFDGTILEVNPSIAIISRGQYHREDLIGKSMYEFYADTKNRDAIVAEMQKKGSVADFEVQLKNRDGSLINCSISAKLSFNVKGQPEKIIGSMHDITERKRAEDELQESETRYRSVLQSATDAIVTVDSSGIIVGWNSGAERIFGYSYTEAVGQALTSLMPLYHQAGHTNEMERVLSGGDQHVIGKTVELEGFRKDKSVFPLELSLSSWETISGQFFTGIIRDITERKRAEETIKKAEFQFRSLTENSPDLIARYDHQYRHLYVNPSAVKMGRYSLEEEYIGKTIQEVFLPEEDAATWEKHVKNVFETGQSIEVDDAFQSAQGQRYLNTKFVPERNSNGALLSVLSITRDITERKRTEEVIRENEFKFRQTFDFSPVGIVMVGLDKRFIHCNQAFSKSLGYLEEDLRGKTIEDITYPEDKNIGMAELKSMMKGEIDTSQVQKRYVRKDGFIVWGDLTISILRNKEKQPQYFIAVIQDITTRKEAEEKLKNSEQLLVETGVVGKVGGWTFNIDTLEQTWTEETYHIHELDLSFKPTVENGINFYTPASKSIIEQAVQRAVEFGEPWDLDLEIKTAKGNIRKVNAIGKADLKNRTIYGFFQDITERKQMELALNKSQTQILSVMNSTDDMIWSVDPQRFGLLTFNQKLKQYFKNKLNVDCQIGMTPEELLPANFAVQWHETYKRALREGSFVTEYQTSNGIDIWLLTVNVMKQEDEVFGISVFSKDITEQKKLEEQMRQMQKLEGLGTLAGGIAHDFNNILGIILAYITSTHRFKDDATKLDLAVNTIVKAVERGKTLVQQILMFARKTETAFGAVNVNDVVMETVTMVMETFPKFISCSQNFDKSISYINADRSQLHQVLMNLCVNARDAMPKGGVLAINTRMVSVVSLRNQHPDATASSYVCIEVSDTGEGMTPETQKRIFEPFFTTKGIGKGTGLGLSVTFGVIQTHKGFIDVESELGNLPAGKAGGTTFRVYLPASQVAEPISENDEGTMEEIPGGIETVLLVEDEEMLLTSLQMVLVDKGYKVLSVQDGFKALKIYQEKKNNIALVITDLGLPNISGLEVCQQIKKINPKERIILATGFLDPEMRAEFLKLGIEHFLFKPYDLKKVLKVTREVLDKK